MPPASPRKSSTSSGRPPRARARYLGIEVAGEPVRSSHPPPWTDWLRNALEGAGAARVAFRIVRAEGPRVVVRVARTDATAARRSWNTASAPTLRTYRTWGTLVGAKRWLLGPPAGRRLRR